MTVTVSFFFVTVTGHATIPGVFYFRLVDFFFSRLRWYSCTTINTTAVPTHATRLTAQSAKGDLCNEQDTLYTWCLPTYTSAQSVAHSTAELTAAHHSNAPLTTPPTHHNVTRR